MAAAISALGLCGSMQTAAQVASTTPMSTSTSTPASAAPQDAPWAAVVEHVLDLSTRPGDGPRALELSALAWDPVARELVAASDRGRLFRYRLSVTDGRLQAERRASLRLPLEGEARNAESLTWRASASRGIDGAAAGASPSSGELLLGAEQASAVTRLSAQGQPLGTVAWPEAVAAALSAGAEDGAQHGVEAIAWHPAHGLLAALQRPVRLRGDSSGGGKGDKRVHRVHAASGRQWTFPTAGARSQVKAIEARPDGSVLVMERFQPHGDPRLHTVLRWLDLARCGGDVQCVAPLLPIRPVPWIGADNHEGLACTEAGTCWIVNDGGADATEPTWLIQFRLVPR